MEPDCRADSSIWSDHLLQWSTPSTSLGGMSEFMAPLPGLSIWNMPPLEASLPKGPVVSLQYRPPIGRATQLRATLSRQAPVPQAPQMAPPIHQPLPLPRGWPATPYQQAVWLPGKSSGLGVTFDSSATKPAPTGGQDADVHGRQGTQGLDDNSQPASRAKCFSPVVHDAFVVGYNYFIVSKACAGLGNGCERFACRDLC